MRSAMSARLARRMIAGHECVEIEGARDDLYVPSQYQESARA